VTLQPYYDDGRVTIYHGDCREILCAIEADVLVTDPPYGIDHSSNRPGAPRRGRAIIGDADTATRDAVLAQWGERPSIVFGSWRNPPQTVRGVLVWDKGGHVGMGDLSFPWKQNWECIFVAGEGFAGQRGTGVLRHNALPPWGGVITHPHEKPVELLRALLLKCPPGVILDPFMGSGTTLRAAKDHGRQAIGIEIEERYCEIAARRCAQDVLDLKGLTA
jgi:site-specific DNA-methyltransferase (adenine-specific)